MQGVLGCEFFGGIRAVGMTLVLLVVTSGCSGKLRKNYESFRQSYNAGQYDLAEQAIDKVIAIQNKTDAEVVGESKGLSSEIDASRKNTCLYLLEKAMLRLVHGDYATAVTLLNRSKHELADREGRKLSELKGLVDDTHLPYRGADYELIVIRVMLAIADLLDGDNEAFTYSLQINEKQDEILGKPVWEDAEEHGDNVYNPRSQYKRIAIGAYLEGLILEKQNALDDAEKNYTYANNWLGNRSGVVAEALNRVERGRYAQPGHGVVHVFYFAGRGPNLVETNSPPTELALALAKIGAVANDAGSAVLVQDAIPIPQIQILDPACPPLGIVSKGQRYQTDLLLDINQVASDQLAANMPWNLARAVVRRSVKAGVAAGIQKGVGRKDKSAGFILGALFNLFSTAIEKADLRIWRALPAQIQAARVEVPAGTQVLEIAGQPVRVRVSEQQESYIAVFRPLLSLPPRILVDVHSASPTQAIDKFVQ